jgi:hypothetical protein
MCKYTFVDGQGHMLRQLKREKLYLSNVIDGLEVIMEVRPLSTQEIEQKKMIQRADGMSPARRGTQVVPNINLIWKGIRIHDTSMVLQW